MNSVHLTRKKHIDSANASQAMWRHPVTAKQIRVLTEEWGVKEHVSANGEPDPSSTSEGWFQVIKVSLPNMSL